jgi:hypothetical protein
MRNQKATDCQGYNRVTGANCHTKATKHIVEPGTLQMRHFCKAHGWRYLVEMMAAENATAQLEAQAQS